VKPKTTPSAPGLVLAVLFLFPLVWGGYLSVKGQPGSSQATGFGLKNYTAMARYGEGIGRYLLNTAFVAGATVVGTLVIATLGGYGFARFRFPLKNVLFIATLGILMVPYATILIPLYVVLGHLGLQNTLIGLSLVLILFQLPFAVFMMRNAFEGLPRELEEAALVDGCNSFGALRRILLHGVRPALITVGLFAFLASWNDFFAPLILLSDGSKFTLPVALVSIREQTFGAVDYGALEAGVVIMAVPCIALFLGLQRHYVRGFTTGALRG
jgi:multiple sugar transport system permease protein